MIDQSPVGTNSEDLLSEIRNLWPGEFEGVYISSFKPIHTYLTERGSLEDWRRAIDNDRIELIDGHWVMPEETWGAIGNYIYQRLVGCMGGVWGYTDND